MMVLASSPMTPQALHQAAAVRTIRCTLELVPAPSQEGQHKNDSNGDQPSHLDNSE